MYIVIADSKNLGHYLTEAQAKAAARKAQQTNTNVIVKEI